MVTCSPFSECIRNEVRKQAFRHVYMDKLDQQSFSLELCTLCVYSKFPNIRVRIYAYCIPFRRLDHALPRIAPRFLSPLGRLKMFFLWSHRRSRACTLRMRSIRQCIELDMWQSTVDTFDVQRSRFRADILRTSYHIQPQLGLDRYMENISFT